MCKICEELNSLQRVLARAPSRLLKFFFPPSKLSAWYDFSLCVSHAKQFFIFSKIEYDDGVNYFD